MAKGVVVEVATDAEVVDREADDDVMGWEGQVLVDDNVAAVANIVIECTGAGEGKGGGVVSIVAT